MESPAATMGIYCKACGYDLRASAEAGRCPECGRVFSPADPKSFRPRPFAAPWKRAIGRWAKRLAILLLVLIILLAGTWGWYYWGWKQEQAALAQMGGTWDPFEEFRVPHPTIVGGTPGKWLHARGFPGSAVLERVSFVALRQTATDADLLPLRNLAELQSLWVRGPITDAGLTVLRDLPQLESLYLDTVSITDAGLGHVAQLRGLKSLALVRMPLTDAGLAPLEKLPALEVLTLEDTPVTDVGLVHLEKLTALQFLNLTGTKVTPAGVARLRAALPGCTIVGP